MKKWIASLTVRNNAPSVWIVSERKWGAPAIAECRDEKDAQMIADALNAREGLVNALEELERYARLGWGDCEICEAAREAIAKVKR